MEYDGANDTWSFSKGFASYTGMTITQTQVYAVTVEVTSSLASVLTAKADVKYAAAGDVVTVTITKKTGGSISSNKTLTATDGTHTATGTASSGTSPITGTVTINASTDADITITVS